MTSIELIERQIHKYVQKIRPPEGIRDQLDIGFSYEGNTLEIFEIRPGFDDKHIYQNTPVAKARYIKSKNVWQLYWLRANGKWVRYEPEVTFSTISDILSEIDNDRFGCFWG